MTCGFRPHGPDFRTAKGDQGGRPMFRMSCQSIWRVKALERSQASGRKGWCAHCRQGKAPFQRLSSCAKDLRNFHVFSQRCSLLVHICLDTYPWQPDALEPTGHWASQSIGGAT